MENLSLYTLQKTVQAADIDGLGHMNNVVYLQWVEQLAWAHSAKLGLDLTAYQALDAAMVARKHTLEYLAACMLDDEIQLTTWLSHCDGLYLTREYEFKRASDQKIVFKGQTQWVCVRISTGRPMRMPEAFKVAYGAVVLNGGE